ncbi:hypothetical protein BCV70DRAFT_92693 [Testicularia cyperi]|uniref:Uncharacterized protein n=1 Tax=Testicularia cyperi TaxID=1882483 RepID=A0A317XEY0_9BASI|nr:hypothetical protein BCV70DRAFT_92693 [Testicularia cyperi]
MYLNIVLFFQTNTSHRRSPSLVSRTQSSGLVELTRPLFGPFPVLCALPFERPSSYSLVSPISLHAAQLAFKMRFFLTLESVCLVALVVMSTLEMIAALPTRRDIATGHTEVVLPNHDARKSRGT